MSSITLSMIVKNEEKHLQECLESVKDVVDEIVIVDTGSEDNTVKIAEKFGAKIYSYTWNDDFSEARNVALSKCNSDWVFYLDADERLDASSKQVLKSLTSLNKNLGVRCKIYSIDEINKKPKLQYSTRLFKNNSGIKFKGKAHEQIDDSLLETNYQIINSDLMINHIGYNIDKEGLRKKAERNLKLLLKDYQSEPTGYCAFQIANSYSILGNSENSFNYYSLAVKDKSLPNEYKALSLSYIAEYCLKINDYDSAQKSIKKALEYDSTNVIANLTASEIYYRINNSEAAVNYCQTAFEENSKTSEGRSAARLLDVILDSQKILYYGLTISYKLNAQSGIEYFFTKLEEAKSLNKSLWQKELNLIELLTTNSELSQRDINTITDIIDENSLEFYLTLLKNYNLYSVKLQIDEQLLNKYPNDITLKTKHGYNLSKAGKNDEAISVFEEVLQNSPEEVSPIFYLISLYLENSYFDKLNNLITSSKEKFKTNKIFLKHLADVEEKLQT